jgi:hypothetical protein
VADGLVELVERTQVDGCADRLERRGGGRDGRFLRARGDGGAAVVAGAADQLKSGTYMWSIASVVPSSCWSAVIPPGSFANAPSCAEEA